MAQILKEHGHKDRKNKKAQCGKKFLDYPEGGTTTCCCCQMIFNEPDFANSESILEIEARNQGFETIFLLKFHCELNFIEQCWGHAK